MNILSYLYSSCSFLLSVNYLVCIVCPFFYLIFVLFFLIEVQLIYDVVLVSGVQQSDLVSHIYMFIFIFFPILIYYKILAIVPWLYSRTFVVVVLFYFVYSSVCLLIPNS